MHIGLLRSDLGLRCGGFFRESFLETMSAEDLVQALQQVGNAIGAQVSAANAATAQAITTEMGQVIGQRTQQLA